MQIQALTAAQAAGEPLALSAITMWEIAKLAEHGRISLAITVENLFERFRTDPSLAVLPLSPEVALQSTRLRTAALKDPADQIIVATAQVHGLALLTADERIRDAGVVPVL